MASAIQFGFTAVAVAVAVAATYAFRYHRSGAARAAVLLAGTFFVSPYMLNYDLLLMPAVLALYHRGGGAAAEGRKTTSRLRAKLTRNAVPMPAILATIGARPAR